MIPIATPVEMAAIDAASPVPVDELIDRAGRAVARAAIAVLGGTYGRRVLVVAGPGNNGKDGRVAAERLARRGLRVRVVDAAAAPSPLPTADLVIDAAFGTSLNRNYEAPDTGTATVLAVDIPSGVDGLTGTVRGRAVAAVQTVTFAALKSGLLLGSGPLHAGAVTVADIGLDTSGLRSHLVEAADVAAWLPTRPRDAHKWRAACWVIAGSPGMTGAARLAAGAAMRAGAGYVRLSSPGTSPDAGAPTEVVVTELPGAGWAAALDDHKRFGAVVLGPGLGPDHGTEVARALGVIDAPVVLDGDGLTSVDPAALRARSGPLVLTPHEGEAARLGHPVGEDRFETARALAADLRAVVLLKGPLTVVANPAGETWASDRGDQRLATAGTGDVLAGIIAGLLAQGVPPERAAIGGAFLHGGAARLGPEHGLVASELIQRLPAAFEGLG